MSRGEETRARRRACGLTQEELAARAGVSRGSIRNIEAGKAAHSSTLDKVNVALSERENESDAEARDLSVLIARVRADCEAQTLPQTDDTERRAWNLGVWAQAQRVLNILDNYQPGGES